MRISSTLIRDLLYNNVWEICERALQKRLAPPYTLRKSFTKETSPAICLWLWSKEMACLLCEHLLAPQSQTCLLCEQTDWEVGGPHPQWGGGPPQWGPPTSVYCVLCHTIHSEQTYWEVGGWGRVPLSRNLMSPTPRRKWYLTTGRRFH